MSVPAGETQRVFVTGAAGLLGAAVVRTLLGEGYVVRGLYYPGDTMDRVCGLDVEWVKGDICDEVRMLTLMPGCDALIHIADLASFCECDKRRQYRVNVVGTRVLFDAAEQCGIRKAVTVSSIGALGHPEFGSIGDETTAYNWHKQNIPYFKTKHIAQRHAISRAATGFHSVVVNPGWILGEDVASETASYAIGKRKTPFLIVCPKGGTTVSQIGHVARGIVQALEKGRSGESYVLGGTPMLYRELLRTMARGFGKRPVVVSLPNVVMLVLGKIADLVSRPFGYRLSLSAAKARGCMHTLFYSSEKARRELGFDPGDPTGSITLISGKYARRRTISTLRAAE